MEHLTSVCAAVDIPINADFESGFASEPEGVARNVGLALQTGIAGISTEDGRVDGVAGLHDSKLAAERVQAARASIDASGEDDIILVARTERLLSSPDAITQAIDSLVAFAEVVRIACTPRAFKRRRTSPRWFARWRPNP
jgi:2-methylisocitrate lyase-like PEP mutase family enzyme